MIKGFESCLEFDVGVIIEIEADSEGARWSRSELNGLLNSTPSIKSSSK